MKKSLLALTAGALFALAAPPTNLYAALWLGMAGWASLAAGGLHPPRPARRRVLDGAGLGLLFGVGANLVALRFVPATVARFTALPWVGGFALLVLLSFGQGVRWAAAGVVVEQLARRGVPRWLAFGAGVYASTFLPAVFPWSPAGGVTPVPEMVQLAEIVGERGVTLLMALAAGLLAEGLSPVHAPRRRRLLVGVGLALPALTFLEGKVRVARVEQAREGAPTAVVGLVQPGTGPLERWDPARADGILSRLAALTARAEREGAELTVWPEAAYPVLVAHASRRCPVGARAMLPMGVRGPVLAGLVMSGGDGDLWNSAAICSADGTLSKPYDKLHLLAFGESIPLVGGIPWVRRTFSRGAGLVPGEANVVQSTGRIRASVLNCFEDTLPEAGREAMADRPDLLVNVTNDAWFEGSAESELHLRLSALRAVESRRDLVRAVNLGPTSWVDAAGVVRARYASPLPGVLVATPALLSWDPTPFDRAGDLPTAVALALLALSSRQKKKGAAAATPFEKPPA